MLIHSDMFRHFTVRLMSVNLAFDARTLRIPLGKHRLDATILFLGIFPSTGCSRNA